MTSRVWLVRGWLLTFLLGAGAVESWATTPACHRVVFKPPPEWVTSAAWGVDGRELVLADTPGGRLLRYSREGKLLGEEGRPERVQGEYKPTQLHTLADGMLVRNRAHHWIWLDRRFKKLQTAGREIPSGFSVVDEVLQGDQLWGLGLLRKTDQSWFFGFLRARLHPLSPEETIEEIPLHSKEGILYRFLSTTVAIAGGVPYALRFAEPSYLLDLRTRRRLTAFPKGYEKLPALPPPSGPDADVPSARIIEQATLPVALYGFKSSLYLLTRRPGLKEETVWQLHRIDPVKDKLEKTIVLPTGASGLKLVPGTSTWGVLEKEAQSASGKQRVPSMLLIPADMVEASSISCK